MKQIILKITLLIITTIVLFSSNFGQNVGIGTTTPTHFFHVVPSTGITDPVKIEGIQSYNGEPSVLVIDPAQGIIRHLSISQLFTMDTLFFNDTSFNLYRDSLLGNNLFLDSLAKILRDSINTDNQNIDSLTLNGTNLTVHIENGNSSSIDLSAVTGTSTDDQNIDSLTLNGTILTGYIENGNSSNVDLQPIIDSSINNSTSGSDNQNIDSITLNGTLLTTYIEDGTAANINLQPILDSAVNQATSNSKNAFEYTFHLVPCETPIPSHSGGSVGRSDDFFVVPASMNGWILTHQMAQSCFGTGTASGIWVNIQRRTPGTGSFVNYTVTEVNDAEVVGEDTPGYTLLTGQMLRAVYVNGLAPTGGPGTMTGLNFTVTFQEP